MKKIAIAFSLLFSFHFLFAQAYPAKIFADSMVLQRGIKIPVWGWAENNEKVTVQFHQQTKTAIAGKEGKWRVDLDAEKEGGPYQLTIKASNTIVLKDVWVGDVWICSGQSNMEFTVRSANNSDAEIAGAGNPMIRHIKIADVIGDKPWKDIGDNSGWKTAVPDNVAKFTAVGYFFAKELYAQLKVPIGLINTSWGGTDIETWTSREAFANSAEFTEMISGIPSLNIDSLSNAEQKMMQAKIQQLQGGIAGAASVSLWNKAGFNDAQWPHMKVPGLWEQQSLPGFDGVAWYRKTIIIPAADAGKPADISLGMIDDNEETFLNGVRIGSTNGYNINRIYHIPAGVLKEGNNVIAIRVEDTGGGGGLYGAADDLYITVNGHKQSLSGDWFFQVESVYKSGAVGPNSYPALLFNSMINPLIPYGIKGAIWYQGENNAGRAYQYRKAFPLMINDWRQRWGQGNFPFYFVQLASFNSANGNSERGSSWAELREAQTMTLSLPNTGMAVTTDIGESKDIHPKNKQDVGKRLAAAALHTAYGRVNQVYSGPVYQSMKVDGSKIILSFKHTGKGLQVNKPVDHSDMVAANGVRYSEMITASEGFEIAGEDKKFYPAKAVIEGDHVIVSSPHVPAPAAVHYAWADDAGKANLFNKEGFPASPFRTDQWKGITEGAKYRSQ